MFQTDVIYGQPLDMTVPRYRLSTFGRRAFSVAGSSVWNSLPENEPISSHSAHTVQ